MFAAGCLGGMANSLAVWLSGKYGITAAFGVHIAPELTPSWFYPRIVWGGIWGLLFLLPVFKNRIFRCGLLMSVPPTLFQLFVVFPNKGQGMMGLSLGMLTPLFVVIYNAIWGITAAAWIRYIRE